MGSETVAFEAVIVPHRSLGARGFRRLALVLCTLSLAVSLGLLLAGAWPVIGFSGAEVALALWLVRRHALSPSGSELLVLSDAGLRVVRTDRRGASEERVLSAAWLRLELAERPGRVPALVLRSRSGAMEVGAALGEAAKRSLAQALDAALERQRSPMFDNPQLRPVSLPPGPST